MKSLEYQAQAHFVVCCRNRVGKPSCAEKSSEQLVTELKKWIKNNDLKKKIKVTQSSCLGFCEKGITACLYPQNQWFHQISLEDKEKIQEMLEDYAK